MADSLVVSDRYRVPIVAERHHDSSGGVILRRGNAFIILSESELDRLVSFARDEPAKVRVQRFPVVLKSPQTDDG